MKKKADCFLYQGLFICIFSFFGFATFGFAAKKKVIQKSLPNPSRKGNNPQKSNIPVVMKIENKQLLVSFGRKDGAFQGMKVDIYRRVKLRHPLTKQWIEDKFYIGKAHLDQVSTYLSIIKKEDRRHHYPFSVGDYVFPSKKGLKRSLLSSKAITDKLNLCKAQEKKLRSCEMKRNFVHLNWLSLRGKSISFRLRSWRGFLKLNPETKNRRAILSHVLWLMSLQKRIAKLRSMKEAKKNEYRFFHQSLLSVYVGEKVRLTAAVLSTWKHRAVVVFYKRLKDSRFRKLEMKQRGIHEYWVTLPTRMTAEKGYFQYFIEVLYPGGKVRVGKSNASYPAMVSVRRSPLAKNSKQNRSQVNTLFEYVDYYTQAFGTDNYFRFEIDYTYFLQTRFLHNVQMGFGIFEGRGAETLVLEQNPSASTPRAFAYAYLSTEFHFHRYFGLGLRTSLGSVRDNLQLIDQEELSTLFGIQGFIRLGNRRGTHVILGTAFTTVVGIEGWITVAIPKFRRFPMSAKLIVSNLPAGGENIGVRLLYKLGWKPLDWFAIDLQVGWNIRNIRHSGPSIGLGTSFRW